MSNITNISPRTNLDEIFQFAWLNLENVDKIKIKSELIHDVSPFYIENPHYLYLKYFSNPDNFESFCRHFLNVQLLPMQLVILKELWKRPFPMLIGSRGLSKTYLLALYSMLKAFLIPNSKIVIAGAGFRQSKLVLEYCNTFWNRGELFRTCCEQFNGKQGIVNETDRVILRIGTSTIIALPVGDGSKVKGLRASTLIADEFASHNPEVFEIALAGFTATTQNPVENVQLEAKREAMQKRGLWNEDEEIKYINRTINQTILSGTPDYDFNHFAKYWRRYKTIIESKGDLRKLKEIYGEEVPTDLNWRDFSIIRIPYNLMPKGFLDSKQIARYKSTLNKSAFDLEFGAVFVKDSDGYFRRSLIESCVTKDPIMLPSGMVQFSPRLIGSPSLKYVMGIDPASEQDNFCITIIELHPDHNRIVYCWTINRKKHQQMVKDNEVSETDYFAYCVRKIRTLMKLFNIEEIGLDSQGGGFAILEGLHDKDKLLSGELPIWEIIEEKKEKITDRFAGRHIIRLINFADAKWVSEANSTMRKDFEDKVLLFPFFDPLSIGLAIEEDKRLGRKYDTMEECVMEIEELKDELTTIVHTQTGVSGRDRWDVPEIKLPGGKKGRQRKDRYTALLITTMIARNIQRQYSPVIVSSVGGFAQNIDIKDFSGPAYNCPDSYNGLGSWLE